MTVHWKDIAHRTLEGSETDAMSFGEAVRLLADAGFDGYAVDFRRATRTYYMPDGEALELMAAPTVAKVGARFDADAIKAAIWEAQTMVAGYTYAGFCEKAVAAGCAGYLVSLSGKRVVYFGRTGEVHTEYFPGAQR